jgi:predicted O-methyltransferase YrrM
VKLLTPRNALDRLADLAADSIDAQALQALAPLSGPFLPVTSSTMRPAAILAVASDIVINQRRTIVECGSGNSTIFAARALRQEGIDGHIHSVDHDPEWAAVAARAVARENLNQWATVICAPLVNGWYDISLLPEVGGIDLLVVDGPPSFTPEKELARAPALDVFWDRLTPGATIILDDSGRRGEKRVIATWRKRRGVELRHQRGGHAVVRLGSAFNASPEAHRRRSEQRRVEGAPVNQAQNVTS